MPILLLLLLMGLTATRVAAQQWDAPAAQRWAQRAVARRAEVARDTSLTTFRLRATGFVFFSTQIGEGLDEPPRLIKADQLDAEVYWRTPGLSKQVMLAWRDRRYLPTDISYHRDHLTLVLGNMRDRIAVGDGDEVRGVIHPFAPDGPTVYQYAVSDSLTLTMGDGTLRLIALDFRPRDPDAGLAVGRAYLDQGRGDLVRLRLGFTAAAYRDETVEDITFVLENALQEGRFWLPFRQEVEIRRRVAWFDFPARTVIRVRWNVVEVEPNLPLDPARFRGPHLAGVTGPSDTGTMWTEPMDQAVEDAAQPLSQQDLEAARLEIKGLVEAKALQTLTGAKLGTNSVSDLALVNRVSGLRLGLGGAAGTGGVDFKAWLGYGTSDGRLQGRLRAGTSLGGTTVALEGYRRILDLSDLPVISPILNSLRAQEVGKDLGDYVLLGGLRGEIGFPLSPRDRLVLSVAGERSTSVAVSATPVHGTYRPNPPLGAGDYLQAAAELGRRDGGVGLAKDLYGTIRLESGTGPSTYLRATGQLTGTTPVGGGNLLARAYLGWGSDLLPAYRSFVLGGRGTLPGEPFRAYGGRSVALFHVEWRTAVPVPALEFGTFASTGRTITVAPYLAAGWSDRAIAATPWQATDGVRPVAGIGIEWLMNLVRLDVGVGLRDGGVLVTFDVTRAWWPLL